MTYNLDLIIYIIVDIDGELNRILNNKFYTNLHN